MGHTQLSQEERYQIGECLLNGLRPSRIARLLNRSPSTIYRELQRNRGLRGWRPLQGKSVERQETANFCRSRERIPISTVCFRCCLQLQT